MIGSGLVKPLPAAAGASPSYSFLGQNSSSGGGGANVGVTVSVPADAELVVALAYGGTTSPANGSPGGTPICYGPTTGLENGMTAVATSSWGHCCFIYQVPTSVSGTGSMIFKATVAANFKYRGIWVYSLKDLASTTVNDTVTHGATVPSPVNLSIDTAANDLLFSAAYVSGSAQLPGSTISSQARNNSHQADATINDVCSDWVITSGTGTPATLATTFTGGGSRDVTVAAATWR